MGRWNCFRTRTRFGNVCAELKAYTEKTNPDCTDHDIIGFVQQPGSAK